MGKLLDLQHVQALHAKSVRERERYLLKLQQVQQQVEELEASLPACKQEKKKAKKKLIAAEEEKAKWEEVLEETRKDVDIALKSLRAAEKLGDDVLAQVKDCNHKVQDLEKELIKCIHEDRRIEGVKTDLKRQTERLQRLASEKECDITKAEMQGKVEPLNATVEKLREDVTYKIKVFDKIHAQVLESMEGCEELKMDISKCHTEIAKKKFVIQELKVEKKRLEEFIHDIEKTQKKMHNDYFQLIERRNRVGLNLIDRNDELSILYEKVNVQVDLLKTSEVEHNKRTDEIALLERECNRTHQQITTRKRVAPDPTAAFEEFQSLQKQVITARSTLENLSELCENPLKGTKRWRQLKGHIPKAIDLEQKAWAIQVFIDRKEDQATEKDIILDELAALLKSAMRHGALRVLKGTKLSRQMNETARQQMSTSRSLSATISELALVQARAMSMKRQKDDASDQLHDAQLRLAAGEPPTEEAARELAYIEREAEVSRKIAAKRQSLQLEDQKYQEAQHCTHTLRPKTTPNMMSRAEKRPNVYRGGPFELPVPFPVHLPFRPSTQGNSILRRMSKSSSRPGSRPSSVLVAIKS